MDPLRTIFAMDMHTFLESACQGAADEPIKTQKVEPFFPDPKRAVTMIAKNVLKTDLDSSH